MGTAFCQAYGAEYDIVAVCRSRAPAVPSQYESYVDPLDPGTDVPENAGRVHVLYADLEQPGQIERVVEVALARFDKIDLLVNNAAYTRLHPAGLVDGAGVMADFDRHFAVNVGIPIRLAARVATEFWQHRAEDNAAANRNVVNVSSLSGSRVYAGGQAVYAASKAALNHLTRHLGAEFATFGVRANSLAPNNFPGVVDTAEVVAAIVRLDHESVTGRILAVGADG